MGPELLTGLAVAGAGLQAVGMIQQGVAARNEARSRERTAENRALAARQQGEFDARERRREQRRQAGRRRANVGASGIDFSGSVIDVFDDEALEAEQDIFNIRRNALLQEQGFEAQARAERATGSAAMTGGFLGAGSALVRGASRVGSMRRPQRAGGAP